MGRGAGGGPERLRGRREAGEEPGDAFFRDGHGSTWRGKRWAMPTLRGFELEGALAVEMLEEVAFVGLVPGEFPGGNRAEVEAVDVGAVHHGLLKGAVAGDDRGDGRGADFFGGFGLGTFDHRGVGEREFFW